MPDQTGNTHRSKEIDATWIGVLVILLGFGGMVIMFSNIATNTNKTTSSRAAEPQGPINASTCQTSTGMPSSYFAGYDFCAYAFGDGAQLRYCPVNFAADFRDVSGCPDTSPATSAEHCCRSINSVNAVGTSYCTTQLKGNTNVECGRDNSSDMPACTNGRKATTIRCGLGEASTNLVTKWFEKYNYIAGHCCEGPFPTPTPFQPHGTVTDCGDNTRSVNCQYVWGISMNSNSADNKKNGIKLNPVCVFDKVPAKYVCAMELVAGDTTCDGKQYAYGITLSNNIYDAARCLITEKGSATAKVGDKSACKFVDIGDTLTVSQCQAIKNSN